MTLKCAKSNLAKQTEQNKKEVSHSHYLAEFTMSIDTENIEKHIPWEE